MPDSANTTTGRPAPDRAILGLLILVLLAVQLLVFGNDRCPLRPGERPRPAADSADLALLTRAAGPAPTR